MTSIAAIVEWHHNRSVGPAVVRAVDSITARAGAAEFERAFERSPVPMLLVDGDRRCSAANAAAQLLLRRSMRELDGVPFDSLVTDEHAARIAADWMQLGERGTIAGQWHWRDRDGAEPLELDFCAVRDAAQRLHLLVLLPTGWPEEEPPVARPARGLPWELSERERAVLTLLADGLDVSEMAPRLGIGSATVKTHLLNAMRKLGATSRPHAVAIALRAGLLDP